MVLMLSLTKTVLCPMQLAALRMNIPPTHSETSVFPIYCLRMYVVMTYMQSAYFSCVQAVLGAALTIHRLGIKRNVVFVLAIAENSMDSLAFKPHAIIRSHKGLTVEIGNTDAEGR